MDRSPGPTAAIAVGPAAAIAAAGLLASVRDSIGVTNVTLVVAGVVVLAAIAGRTAGVVTGLVAAVADNFFNTAPYRSLRIADRRDVITIALLVVIGIAVGEVAERRRRAARVAHRHAQAERSLAHVAAALASGASESDMWQIVHDGVARMLRLRECRFEPVPMSTMVPHVGRDGSLPLTSFHVNDQGTAMPAQGAALDVVADGDVLGQIVLVPDGRAGSTRDERRIAVAMADLYAAAIRRSSDRVAG